MSGPAILYDHDLIDAAKYVTLGNGTRWLAQARQLRHGADERTRQELHRVVALDRRGLDPGRLCANPVSDGGGGSGGTACRRLAAVLPLEGVA